MSDSWKNRLSAAFNFLKSGRSSPRPNVDADSEFATVANALNSVEIDSICACLIPLTILLARPEQGSVASFLESAR
jgi:hypothetical protein